MKNNHSKRDLYIPKKISFSERNENSQSYLNINNEVNNFLTETSCDKIQKILRKDYFKRLQSVSPNNKKGFNIDDFNPKENIINNETEKEKPTTYAAKQIMFSNKIRRDNYNWIKNHKRKDISDGLNNKILNNYEEYKKEFMDKLSGRKEMLPTIKKVYKDNNPILYNIKYIDEVENKYIQPYINNKNVIYTDFIENKKSKAPFNFYIS